MERSIFIGFRAMLIRDESSRLLENAFLLSLCAVNSGKLNQCPAGGRGKGEPAGVRASRKALGLTAIAKQPGEKINSHF